MTTTTSVEVLDSVRELPDSARQLLAGVGSLYAAPDWLGYCQASAGEAMRLVLLRDESGEGVVGIAVVRRVEDDQVMPLYNLESLLVRPRAETYPSLVAAVSGGYCVLAVVGESAAVRARRRTALVRAVMDVAASGEHVAAGFLYLTEEDAAEVAVACGSDVDEPILVAARAVLAGGWPDFEGYLATLPSPRRNKIRRERKQFAAAGFTTRVLHGADVLGEESARLQLALRNRYGVAGSIEAILRDYENLRTHVDDRIRVFLSEKDGVPIGLCLALVDGDELHLRLAGFDYEAVGSDFAYFNVVYYEPIEWGIRHGVRSYHFGTGTYRAKTARGCSLEPLYAVVRWPAGAHSDHATQARERAAELATELGLEPTAPHGAGGRA